MTPNDIRFVAVFFKLRINSSTDSDRFLFCSRSFTLKCKMDTSKLSSSNVGVT